MWRDTPTGPKRPKGVATTNPTEPNRKESRETKQTPDQTESTSGLILNQTIKGNVAIFEGVKPACFTRRTGDNGKILRGKTAKKQGEKEYNF